MRSKAAPGTGSQQSIPFATFQIFICQIIVFQKKKSILQHQQNPHPLPTFFKISKVCVKNTFQQKLFTFLTESKQDKMNNLQVTEHLRSFKAF
jgi:hypothetical protein